MFSTSAEYALCLLVHLARAPDSGALQTRALAEATGIPRHYTAKILASLSRLQFALGARGRNGGYRLAVRADQVRLFDVIWAFDRHAKNLDCLRRGARTCDELVGCHACSSWGAITYDFLELLKTRTLADLVDGAPIDASGHRP